ncbi:MAG TPA: VCBS repeat-containing protein [Verrucomicrobiae bacterium]|nr:VCBS repeat-containing protein [Verrucomicrobiae bacterium]
MNSPGFGQNPPALTEVHSTFQLQVEEFTAMPGSPVPASARTCWMDFDNDGRLDFFASSLESRLFRNTGDGTFSEVLHRHPSAWQAIAAGDWNRDGWIDFVTGDHEVLLFQNLGNGLFTNSVLISSPFDLEDAAWGDSTTTEIWMSGTGVRNG